MPQDPETRLTDARAIVADTAHNDDFQLERACTTIAALSDDTTEVANARRLLKLVAEATQ